MQMTVLALTLLLAYSPFSLADLKEEISAEKTPPQSECANSLGRSMVSTELKLSVISERSTEEITEILADINSNQFIATEKWIFVDLVQDQSHLEKTPPIPNFVLNLIAKREFNKKVRTLITDARPKSEFPKLMKMYFTNQSDEFREVKTNLSAHTIIKVKVKDLPVILDWFVETMYHPALGNKVFKISLLN